MPCNAEAQLSFADSAVPRERELRSAFITPHWQVRAFLGLSPACNQPSHARCDSHTTSPSGAMLRRVLGVGSTGLLASQLAVHAMPLDSSWSRSRVSLAQSAQPDQRPVVICGPSGVGKGTLLTRLMAEHPDSFGFSVSHTTRQPRAGEVDGVHYHFVKKEDMEAAITRGEFIEYARVHSNMYGTSVKAVEDVRAAGKTCLLDIDVQARAPCAPRFEPR